MFLEELFVGCEEPLSDILSEQITELGFENQKKTGRPRLILFFSHCLSLSTLITATPYHVSFKPHTGYTPLFKKEFLNHRLWMTSRDSH